MIYVVTNNNSLKTSYKKVSVEESLHLLSSLTKVGFDTETSGLDVYTKDLKLAQLGNKEFQVVIDTTTIDITLYKEFFESDRLFIGHNIKFDLKWLYKYNIIPKRVYDTYTVEKLLYMGYPDGVITFSLKSLCERYLNITLDKTVRGKIIYMALNDEIILYAANDVVYLEDLVYAQYKELKKKDLLTATDYENRFIRPLTYMEFCGVKLDEEKWKNKMENDEAKVKRCVDLCNNWILENEPNSEFVVVDRQGNLFGDDFDNPEYTFNTEPKVNINWNSPKQLIPLFKKYGVNVLVEDKKKGGMKESLEAKVLSPQKDKCSLIPLYVEYKEASKVTSTYGENFLKQINPVSHRIHTNFNGIGCDTGRLSSGGKDKENNIEYINMQNLPADAITRACFVAEEGNSWISIDYSGEESVIMASVADDKAMINELMYGEKDLHTLTAKIVFDYIPKDMKADEVKKKFHEERNLAKRYEFAFNYGGNDSTIKRNFGLTDEKAKSIYESYMKGFNGLKNYQQYRTRDWLNKGYILINEKTGHKSFIYGFEEIKQDEEWIKTIDWDEYRKLKAEDFNNPIVKRLRKFYKTKSEISRNSINSPIQGTGSIIFKVASINFFNWIVKNNLFNIVKICIPVHDEINCEAPKEIAEKVAQKLYECMVKAGEYFCTRCKLDAEISRDKEGNLPTYWIH